MELALQEYDEHEHSLTPPTEYSAQQRFNLRWSYGEPPERSHPSQRSQYLTGAEIFQVGYHQQSAMNDAPDAVTASEYTRSLDETNGMREEQNEIIANRTLVPQTGVNPFFGENHYIQDLDIQSQFLRPRNSNYEGSGRIQAGVASSAPPQPSSYQPAQNQPQHTPYHTEESPLNKPFKLVNTNQPTNQSTNQSTNQLINHPINTNWH